MPRLKIVHILPDLLNLYGDGGNVRILAKRLKWRGFEVELTEELAGDPISLAGADLVFIGGAPDREQRIAADKLNLARTELLEYVESNGALLAICGGYQMLGHEWVLDGESVEGLGVLNVRTKRIEGAPRIIDNIVLSSPLSSLPVVGYENHAGRTYLEPGTQAFGKVISAGALGNNGEDLEDGVIYKHAVGSYLHGPLLAKNPQVADWFIRAALKRKFGEDYVLETLDDSLEIAANHAVCNKLNVAFPKGVPASEQGLKTDE